MLEDRSVLPNVRSLVDFSITRLPCKVTEYRAEARATWRPALWLLLLAVGAIALLVSIAHE